MHSNHAEIPSLNGIVDLSDYAFDKDVARTRRLQAGQDLPSRAIRETIGSAIHLIVQQSRMRDGARRITNITEVVGREGDTITLQDVFLFQEAGLDATGRIIGKLTPTGIRPSAMAKLYAKRIPLTPALAALYPDRKAPDFTVGVRR